MRKLKILGLALVVVGALSAVAASSVFAAFTINGQATGGSVVASQTTQHKSNWTSAPLNAVVRKSKVT